MSVAGRTIHRLIIVRAALLLLLFAPCAAPARADQRFAQIEREMKQLVETNQLPSIAVAVARDGHTIWEAAFGWADRERRIPATPRTMYSLASISKPFTATAVMKLVEAGRVALDGAANDYLGEAHISGEHSGRATVRHVLTHTAGLPPYFRTRPAMDAWTFDATITSRAIISRPPGRRYVYSNLGYGILDHIVEQVSGVSYEEFLRREVLDPLGLTRTSVPSTAPADAAVRYAEDGTPLPFYDLDHRGASSVYASARDLVRFGMSHLDQGPAGKSHGAAGRVLEAGTLREMQRVQTWIKNGEGYGLGWRIDDDQRGFRQVGHTGGMPGVTTVLSLFPTHRVVVVVLVNARDDRVVPLAQRVAAQVVPAYAWHLRRGRE
ncbi:MAG TPA: serine hydrolase domain-containing protein [Vicinamibacterales bacterium]|nr:serine hydrolase domain-containing protein [Vicinamibacterales bacterium]